LNILFVSYGGFDCNSSPFIADYADAIGRLGCKAAVAVSQRGADDVRDFKNLAFTPTDHESAFTEELFPDGRPADVIHAWTPRENVRKTTVHYAQRHGSKVVVHLEDNEEHIASVVAGEPFPELEEREENDLARMLPEHVSHPRRYKLFLDYSDATTVVWPSLQDFLPPDGRVLHLPVCPRPEAQSPPMPDSLAAKVALAPDEKVMVYSGGINRVNLPDQRLLYEAVVLLNQGGVKCRLLRTGPGTIGSANQIYPGSAPFVTELGFVSRAELLAVIKRADVFVQPGLDDEFNRYRLPCKIPEFLALGCPAVLPASNFGSQLEHEKDALILRHGSAAEIAHQCRKILTDHDLARRLSSRAKKLSEEHFALDKHAQRLVDFYSDLLISPKPGSKTSGVAFSESAFIAGVLRKAAAKSDWAAVSRASVQLAKEAAPHTFRAQAYVREFGKRFEEPKSETLSFAAGGRRTLEFKNLCDFVKEKTFFIRFDPVDAAGEFELHRIGVRDCESGIILAEWAPRSLVLWKDVRRLRGRKGSFSASSRDPSFLLPVFALPPGSRWSLAVEISVDGVRGSISSIPDRGQTANYPAWATRLRNLWLLRRHMVVEAGTRIQGLLARTHSGGVKADR
jgi:glycosyltransferase involved in cell wall biosynthesis